MGEKSLDRLFLRYRRKGDTAALGEVFDRAAPELLKLSMHLVRDPVEAEDVLQATFLAAIEGADSFDASRRLMPWLTGILARQAGLARRRARRVVEADRLTERESVDPAEAAELREFSEELVLALQELPDNYREVLWLHLADGKRPVDIAQALNRAPGTVRMQVHRGLDLLRRALPAGYAAGAGILGATRGLAAIRVQVLADATLRWKPEPTAQGTPSTPGSIESSIGALSTFTKLAIVVLGLLAIVTGVWWRTSGSSSEKSTLARADVAAPTAANAIALEPSSETSTRSALVRESTGESKTATFGPIVLRGRVLGSRSDECSEVALTVRGVARFALPAELTVRGNPGADGRFELDVTHLFKAAKPKRPLEELVLEADHARYAHEVLHIPLQGPVDSVYQADLELSPAALVGGRVLTPSNQPAAATVVALYAIVGGAPLEPPVDRGVCADDGTFNLRARRAGDHAVLVLADGLRPKTLSATLTPGFSALLGTIVLDEGAVIDGIAYHMGRPLRAGALVSAGASEVRAAYALETSRLGWIQGSFERAGRIVETDQDGHFRISGLVPGAYVLGVVRAAPEGSRQSQRRLLSSTAASSVVQAPASRVELRTSFAIVRLRLQAKDDSNASTHKPALVHFRQQGNSTEFPLEFDGAGSVSVEPLAECAVRVEAEGFLGQDLAFAAPGPGEESTQIVLLQRDPALARLSIEVRVPLNASASKVTDAAFHFVPKDASSTAAAEFVRHATSDDGVFQLADLPAGTWSVSCYAGGVYEHYRECWCEAKTTVHLSASSAASAVIALERGGQLQISAANRLGSFLAAECTLNRIGGEALDVEFVGRGPKASIVSRRTLSALGSSDVHPILRAGKYEISFAAKGYESARTFVEIEPGVCARVKHVLQEEPR